MKKLLFLLFTILIVTIISGCSKPAATLPTVIGSGSITVPTYKITAPLAGKILGLISEPGERIGQGQPLFAIEQPDLDSNTENAATEVARAEAELSNLESGNSEQAIAAALYSVQSSEQAYQVASQNYQKMSSLYAQNAIARIKVEQAQTALNSASSNLEQAREHYARLSAKASPEEIANQKQATEATQANYNKLLKKQQSNEAQSPCTGVITEKLLKNGDIATLNQHVLTLIATEQCQVILKVSVQQAEVLTVGQEIFAESANLKKKFPGKITAINDNQITILIENKLEELKNGMEVSISLKK